MLPEDVAHIRRAHRIALDPHRTRIVVTEQGVDAGDHAYAVTVRGLSGDFLVRAHWECGDIDPMPAWSPAGDRLAFLSRSDQGIRLVVADPDGASECIRLVPPDTTPTHITWAGNDRLVIALLDADRSGAEVMRRVTTLLYRSDGLGRREDRAANLYLLPAGSDDWRPLTAGPYLDAEPIWLPGAAAVAFTSDREAREAGSLARDLFLIGLDGGQPRRITAQDMLVESPAPASDGRTVLFRAIPVRPGNDVFTGSAGLFEADPGSGRIRPCSRGPIGDIDVTGFADAEGGLAVCLRRHGSILLQHHRSETPEVTELSGAGQQVTAVAAVADTVAYVTESPVSPGTVVVADASGQRIVLDLGEPFGRRCRTFALSSYTTTTSDGAELEGWVAVPDGDGPHPAVLMVHGGPHYSFGWAFLDQVHVLAEAGYAVIFGNPRGSAGYGDEAARFVVGRFGQDDADDVCALLAAGIRVSHADPDRLAVLGASYGGFMSAWLAARTELFRTAIIDRPVLDWESMRWTSDLGVAFTDTYLPGGPREWHQRSPLTHVDRIDVPCLLMVAEHDLRCPVDQAERMFARLRHRGIDAELWTVAAESHMFHVIGRPASRIRRFEVILDWLGRHLPVRRARDLQEASA